MTESHIDKQMVQMGLVGPERRLTSHHSQRHNSQRVEHGDAQHCKRERSQADPLAIQFVTTLLRAHCVEQQHGHQRPKHQCSAITNKHL